MNPTCGASARKKESEKETEREREEGREGEEEHALPTDYFVSRGGNLLRVPARQSKQLPGPAGPRGGPLFHVGDRP